MMQLELTITQIKIINDKDRRKNNVWLQLYIMIEIIIIYQPVTVQKRLNHRESSVGKLSDKSTRFQH